ncbi:MAG: glycosyltransferase [Microscillaceae bacterium]|nr:glycosyltransferase [Microscillaceae bacterium]MDW8460689.1 glycosyltransferase [Cytophagales bacterium]
MPAKTCFAYPNCPLAFSETFIQNQRDRLAWDTFLCHSHYPCLDKNGKPVLGFPFNNLYLRGIFKRIDLKTYEKYYTQQLAYFLQKNQIGLVFAEYGPTGANMVESCQLTKTKLVVHFHGFDAFHKGTLEKYREKYLRIWQYASRVVVVSKDMEKQLVSLGAKAEKLVYNPYGIDTQFFTGANPAQNSPLFVAVGRFTPKKAPQNTLQAFAQVLKYCPEARLQMIGKGELWESCIKLAQKLGITDKVTFSGVGNPTEVRAALLKARAFVQHSVTAPNGDSEGTPNSILEASAMGLPIVSTRHAGIKEAVIDQETGFLVQEHDIEAMAEKMLILAQNPTLAQTLGKRGQEHIRTNYDLTKRLEYLWQIVQNAY